MKLAQAKYGLENFKKEILIEGFFSKDEINQFEKCAIRIERFLGKAEYNIAYGGDGGFTGFWGTDLCSESKRRKQGQYIKDLLSKLSEEERKEFYRKRTEKTLITWQQNGTKHETFKGKHHSEEIKNKMRESPVKVNAQAQKTGPSANIGLRMESRILNVKIAPKASGQEGLIAINIINYKIGPVLEGLRSRLISGYNQFNSDRAK